MQEKNRPTVSEDIDLFALIERSLVFFRRYRWIFLAAVLLGIAFGLYFYKTIPKTYKSKMVVHSYFLTNPEEIQIVKNWNELIAKNEHETLAQILHCDVLVLHKVKRVRASEIQQVFSQDNPNGFIVEALVTDNEILDELQTALVYGFEHNEYVRPRLEMKIAGIRELLAKAESEFRTLDSTSKVLEDILYGKGRASSSLIVDGSTINTQLIELNEKILSLKESMKFTSAVQVLQGFSKFRQPAGPKLLPLLAIGLLLFLVLAWFVTLIHSIREGLRERTANKTTG